MIFSLSQVRYTLTLRLEKKIKSAAQGLITLATYGVGMLIGFWIAGKVSDAFIIQTGQHDWDTIWKFPALFALGVFLLFLLIFKNEKLIFKISPDQNNSLILAHNFIF